MPNRYLPPDPGPTIANYCNMGYTLETALADIIDNSITALATDISITANTIEEPFWMSIIDNGVGMSPDELDTALTFSSKHPDVDRDANDLGRFGLGLKTASLSQCRRLTVVTRKDNKISSGIWDLDQAEKPGWNWDCPSIDDPGAIVTDTLRVQIKLLGESGTLVMWENMVRYEDQDDDPKREELKRQIVQSREHLERTFHRFITGYHGRLQQVRISVNDNPLAEYDPFRERHTATERYPTDPEEMVPDVFVQAFTLPHHSMLSDSEWNDDGGSATHLDNQGLYIYRANRLLVNGDWLKLQVEKTSQTQLTRVKIDIPNTMDKKWGVQLHKSTARLPENVRARLNEMVGNIVGPSKRRYQRRGTSLASSEVFPVWERVLAEDNINYQINTDNPVVKGFYDVIDSQARGDFNKMLRFIGEGLPLDNIVHDFSHSPKSLEESSLTDEELCDAAVVMFSKFREFTQDDVEKALDMLRLNPPFKHNWDRTQKLLKEKLGL